MIPSLLQMLIFRSKSHCRSRALYPSLILGRLHQSQRSTDHEPQRYSFKTCQVYYRAEHEKLTNSMDVYSLNRPFHISLTSTHALLQLHVPVVHVGLHLKLMILTTCPHPTSYYLQCTRHPLRQAWKLNLWIERSLLVCYSVTGVNTDRPHRCYPPL